MTPPIIPDLEFPDVPTPAASSKAERLPLYVCTLSESDAGEACPRCGRAGGPGHGVKR